MKNAEEKCIPKSISLRADAWQLIRKLAEKEHASTSEWVANALAEKIERMGLLIRESAPTPAKIAPIKWRARRDLNSQPSDLKFRDREKQDFSGVTQAVMGACRGQKTFRSILTAARRHSLTLAASRC